jgi:hydroxylamine reductase (hybrid-cluster protein)
MPIIDFSSGFNTIIPQQLIHKLDRLGLNTSPDGNWLLDSCITVLYGAPHPATGPSSSS